MNDGQLPLIPAPFAMDDCKAMLSVIKGYCQFLQHAPLFPEKETQEVRNRRIKVLGGVADRLDKQLTVNPAVIQLPLDAEEVEEIIRAMLGFVVYIKQTVPQSVQRDKTLSVVDALRLRLVDCASEYPGVN